MTSHLGLSSPVASLLPAVHPTAFSVSSSSLSSSSTSTVSANGDKPMILTKSPLGSNSQSKKTSDDYKPSFHYDSQVLAALIHYLETKNHTGLALIARQKGIPPFLRFQVWPTLLKYHPFVRAPFIAPSRNKSKSTKKSSEDSVNSDDMKSPKSGGSSLNNSDNDDIDDYLKLKIMKDLARYSHKYYHYRPSSNAAVPPNQHTITAVSPTTGTTTAATSTSPSVTSSPKLDLTANFSDEPTPLNSSQPNFEEIELQIFTILQNSIHKFINKWGKIISYDSSLTWMALNLAEWFPPIPNTSWVLIGRDAKSGSGQHVHSHVTEDGSSNGAHEHGNPKKGKNVMDLLDDYSNYIHNVPELDQRMQNLVAQGSPLTFYEVYERLVLVLLHLPETRHDDGNNLGEFKVPKRVNKTSLPVTGGTIEERVLFFVYCLRNLLPELSQFFQEEQILKKFGPGEDEWLIWWLKYTTSKCWSKYDRGRIWDLMFGWRTKNPKKSNSYYLDKLAGPSLSFMEKLGPDVFWLPRTTAQGECNDAETLSDKAQELHISGNSSNENINLESLPTNYQTDTGKDEDIVPYSCIDPHIEVVFISIAMLKAVENTLVELDQHEIRQYLSRLPSKSYAVKSRRKQVNQQQVAEVGDGDKTTAKSGTIVSNDSPEVHRVDYIDNIINEAGEMWRKWLYLENIDEL